MSPIRSTGSLSGEHGSCDGAEVWFVDVEGGGEDVGVGVTSCVNVNDGGEDVGVGVSDCVDEFGDVVDEVEFCVDVVGNVGDGVDGVVDLCMVG